MYFKGEPLYPFGYGLSYTSFKYSRLKLSSSSLKSDGIVNVSLDVKNTGTREGEEVVQLYVKHLNSKVARPLKELKSFKRVSIKAGQTQRVILPLRADQLAYWDIKAHRFVLEPGSIELLIGSSSADARLNGKLAVGK